MVNFDYLYKPEAAKAHFAVNHFLEKKLDFKVIENGMILPHKNSIPGLPRKDWFGFGGIVDSNGEFIKESSVHTGVGAGYTPSPESIKHRPETVIYLTIFLNVWGHVITDNIRRLWFLNNEVFRKEFKTCPIVYVPWNEGYYTIDRMPDARRLLEILGVDFNRLQPIIQPTQFDKIILPKLLRIP